MQTRDYARAALWDTAIKFSLQSRAMTSPDHLEANPFAFRLLSLTILTFALYQLLYKDILKSFHLPLDATASFKPHLLLPSDEPTAFVTF